MVVSQKLVKEIDGLITDEALVLCIHKRVPRLPGEARENVVVLWIQFNIVLVQILEQLLGTKNLGDLDQLIRVAVAVEEGFLAEDHRCKHGTQRPHVQGVVVLLEINEQLGALEIA